MDDRRSTSPQGRLLVLLFLSGAAALIYEVAWFKRFAQVFGSTGTALAVVAGSFLAGLGLGAALAGRRADDLRSPLRAYALCELAIGLSALLVSALLPLAGRALAFAYDPLAGPSAAFTALQVFAAVGLLVVPCAAMGATLPLAVASLGRLGEDAGRSSAALYAVNTLGAAVGCWAAGFQLLPRMGWNATVLIAALLNVVVAVAGWILGRNERALSLAAAEADLHGFQLRLPRARTGQALAAFLFGASALCLHVVWFRQLAVVLGGTTYAYSAMLLVVLLGIAAGSLLARGFAREGWTSPALVGALVMIGCVAATVAQRGLPDLARAVGELRSVRADPWGNALVCVAVAAVLEFVPALVSGALLPLLVAGVGAGGAYGGRAAGTIFAANTSGACVACALAAGWLLPELGGARLEQVALLGLVLGAAAMIAAAGALWQFLPLGLLTGAAVMPIAYLREHDPRRTQLGLYLYGPELEEVFRDSEVLHFESGRVADVFVARVAGGTTMRINGKVDASSFAADVKTQRGSAYLARILRPAAERLLVVGYGSGGTIGASLLFPDVRATCVEIEPAVVRGAHAFEAANHNPRQSPGLELVIDDARSWIAGTRETYDLIVTEPSNPWLPGVSNLFTVDFYRDARARLGEDGLLAQWIQTYAMDAEQYALVLATMAAVFPHQALYELGPGDTLLVASGTTVLPDDAGLERFARDVRAVPAARADLRALFGTEEPREILYSAMLLGEDALRAFASRARGVHTDLNLRLEYETPLALFGEPASGELERLLRAHADPGLLVETAQRMGGDDGDAYRRRLADFATWRADGARGTDTAERPQNR